MKKRTYGTGSVRQLPRGTGRWLLRYKPQWAPKRLSKCIEAPNKKAAEGCLVDWVRSLDAQVKESR
jgi:hypothetical protein